MFSRKALKPLAGIRKKVRLMEENESIDMESFDAEDVSEFEADFMNVGVSHKMHERYIYVCIYTKILDTLSSVLQYNFIYKYI